MTLIAILVCLGLQRYLGLNSFEHQISWIEPYFKWMRGRLKQITQGHGFVGLLLLIIPLLLIISIVFALTYHLLGSLGYVILSVALLWYCLDARDLHKHPYENAHVADIFVLRYRHQFALLFWYFLFGPVGLALYIAMSHLHDFLTEQKDQSPSLQKYTNLALGVLDWVPVRLLGLSFALVGQFSATFKAWMKDLPKGIAADQKFVANWGQAALHEPANKDEAIATVDRALLVWLVVLALVVIARAFG